MKARERYEQWCRSKYIDQTAREELLQMAEDEKEIEDRFYQDLSFGTGGLRGIMGIGANRMNVYTVRKATQGLANYILEEDGSERGVAIAYDSRNGSAEFAKEAALCLAANGIIVYLFEALRPTPELSFALRKLGCIAGIVITASHNPPAYNGYKVYWEDGAQITFPKDINIIEHVNQITDFSLIKTMELSEAKAAGLYRTIGKDMDDRYMEALKGQVLCSDALRHQAGKLKVVYTPLHGTGNLPVRRILKEIGLEKVYVVPEQELPDGNFPTVDYPNPEDKNAFALALALAKEKDADLVLATDPDADRLGLYAKDTKTGQYQSFTGNMLGALILEHRLSQMKRLGCLPENGAVVTTIVSGKMVHAIAEKYGIHLVETLTGFKYIGEQIKFFEQQGSYQYLFGCEESYGYLIGTYARDKDAVGAAMALCEAAACYAEQESTLCQQMDRLYGEYGYYMEDMYTLTLQGFDGIKKIHKMMEKIRSAPFDQLGGFRVIFVRDYLSGKSRDWTTGLTADLELPKSDVVYFDLSDDAWCCIRPSGTEPKIKFYCGVRGITEADANTRLNNLMNALKQLGE